MLGSLSKRRIQGAGIVEPTTGNALANRNVWTGDRASGRRWRGFLRLVLKH